MNLVKFNTMIRFIDTCREPYYLGGHFQQNVSTQF